MNLQTKWASVAMQVAHSVLVSPGKLIGVGVDNEEKATWFINFWKENFPFVKVVDQVRISKIHDTVLIRVRKDELQS